MRTRNGILIFLLLTGGVGFAQNGTGQQNWLKSNNFDESISVFDKDGRPFVNTEDDVSGSSFFLPEWKYGRLRLADSIGYDHIRLRLNLQTQVVHFLGKNNVEMVLPKGFVREVVLIDSTAPDSPSTYIFRDGFPAIDNQDGSNFYQVLTGGRLKLLRSTRKIVSMEKNSISGEERKEIREYTDYYLFSGGMMKKLKKDRAFILGSVGDKKDKVEAYAAAGKLNFKSIDDIGRIITYYNGLP
jgi:hypothetical protein